MSGRSVDLVRVRRARPADAPARGALLRSALHDHFVRAWLLFLFQEVTLQGVLLSVCVAYIFLHCGALQLAALLVGCTLLVGLLVYGHHLHLAEGLAQSMLVEEAGWVAEVCGRRGGGGAAGERPPHAISITGTDEHDIDDDQHWQVIGSVSVSDDPWTGAGCRLRALAVTKQWRRRGVGGALVSAAAHWWAARGWPRPLLASANELQAAARAVLSRAGFQLAACGARPLLGGAIYLHEAHFVMHTKDGRLLKD